MNIDSIAGWLEAIGVPPEVISIGVEADNAWCVLRTERIVPAGQPRPQRPREPVAETATPDATPPDAPEKPAGSPAAEPAERAEVAWEVFWREQGNRYDWASFTNEQVACHYLFGRLAWSQVVRGAVGLLPEKPPAPSPVDQTAPPPTAG